MDQERLISITISLPKTIRDLLRRMAAEQNLRTPTELRAFPFWGRRGICGHLQGINEKKEGECKK